uniref:Uncharacterized protein n=1 Tax=Arundo donax TaxID=35708 RepID=A0A0A9CLG7_ARUDO
MSPLPCPRRFQYVCCARLMGVGLSRGRAYIVTL